MDNHMNVIIVYTSVATFARKDINDLLSAIWEQAQNPKSEVTKILQNIAAGNAVYIAGRHARHVSAALEVSLRSTKPSAPKVTSIAAGWETFVVTPGANTASLRSKLSESVMVANH